jgi:hypothetical protein
MKFDIGIASKYIKSVEDAFETIISKGNKTQRFIARTILESDMLLRVGPVSQIRASGVTGVIDPARANKRIRRETLSLTEAFSEVYIAIAEETIDTGGQRGCEGTLVHEGRHAYDFAQTIASFSVADSKPLSIFNPSLYELEWEAHQTSGDYMILIGKDEYLQEGIDLMILGERNGRYYVNDKGIKKRLNDSYGLQENGNRGPTASDLTGLKMKD